MKLDFVGQPFDASGRLGKILGDCLPQAERFHVVAAWAQVSGMHPIEGEIRALKDRGGVATAILGVDGGIATRESLELAAELFDPVHVFHDTGNRLFHPKIYCVETPEEIVLAVGSSNFTGSGLFLNYEANFVVRLDPQDAEDRMPYDQVLAFRETLLGAGMPWVRLDADLVEALATEETLVTSSQRRAEMDAVSRGKSEGVARAIFGEAVVGLPGLPQAPAEPVPDSAGVIEERPASSAPSILRWWKKLTASDVLRKPQASHQRNYVVLNKAGHPIDQKVWFREQLFGSADWSIKAMQGSGGTKEVAEVEFEVLIEDEYLGRYPVRIDHAERRIAKQNNAPTYLNWSSIIDVVRENDFQDWWLDLALLTDQSFRLKLAKEEPVLA